MNKHHKAAEISFFQLYLTVWAFLCIVAGISIPIAVLIWVMIYLLMMKVDFRSVRQAGSNPKGLFVT